MISKNINTIGELDSLLSNLEKSNNIDELFSAFFGISVSEARSTLSGPRIFMKVWTDDHVESTTIDVTPYFEQSLKDITLFGKLSDLRNANWTCDDALDEIVYFMQDNESASQASASLDVIFNHINKKSAQSIDCGFGTSLEEAEVSQWVKSVKKSKE